MEGLACCTREEDGDDDDDGVCMPYDDNVDKIKSNEWIVSGTLPGMARMTVKDIESMSEYIHLQKRV